MTPIERREVLPPDRTLRLAVIEAVPASTSGNEMLGKVTAEQSEIA